MARNTQAITKPPASTRRRQRLTFGDITNWARESRNELRKVTWPTPEQTRNLTLVVLAVCIIMAAFLGLVDFLLGYIVRFVIGI